MKKRGKFICVEGGEGSGKTTQIRLLYDALTALGMHLIRTREPGGSETCQKIRNLLVDPATNLVPRAEILLYLADREQHLEEVVIPALEAGIHVLCDRYRYSTVAYQLGARGLENCAEIVNAVKTIDPDLAILLDGPVEEGLPRARARSDSNKFELEDYNFHNKVRSSFLQQFGNSAAVESGYMKIVNVSGKSIEDIHHEILSLVLAPFESERIIEELKRQEEGERARIFGSIVARVAHL